VQFTQLPIPDAYLVQPVQHADERGVFMEWFHAERFATALGFDFGLRQVNTSVSKRGVVRGIHFADIPPGQAKYVTATRGAIIDFVVDIRVGSPTFGQWEAVRLDDVNRHAVYLSEGLGHAFAALTDEATVSYLVSDVYRPDREHGINPLDPEIGLAFPDELGEPVLSPKDLAAPTLAHARDAGLLPTWIDARAHYDSLRHGKG